MYQVYFRNECALFYMFLICFKVYSLHWRIYWQKRKSERSEKKTSRSYSVVVISLTWVGCLHRGVCLHPIWKYRPRAITAATRDCDRMLLLPCCHRMVADDQLLYQAMILEFANMPKQFFSQPCSYFKLRVFLLLGTYRACVLGTVLQVPY